MRRTLTVREIPEEMLEAVADAVRLCRAATGETTGRNIIDWLKLRNPELDDATATKAAGYAALLLDKDRD